MAEGQVQEIAPGRDYTAGFRLREQIGAIGRWVPPWGMLSVQRYVAGGAVLYGTFWLRDYWWEWVLDLGFPINIAVGLLLLFGPVVLVVVLMGRWESRNVSPFQVASGRVRLAARGGRAVTEAGRVRPPRRVVVCGSMADVWVRSTWVEPREDVRYGA